ncbi:MAG: FGGY-family carbohydrate kinase [Lachnospiraceae bacterium]
MEKTYFMGIDIGTYESKGALINAQGSVIATHSCPHDMETIKPGYAEHDAEKTWWHDFCIISNALISSAEIEPKYIEAVGCSTIAPCCLPVDYELNPLRKAILYGVDVRVGREIEYLEQRFGKKELFEKCGTPITSQSAGAKLLWIKNNEPEIYNKTYKFVTGSTYLTAKLTGKFVIDHYTAACWTPMYSVEKQDWEEDLSLFCRRDQLAECRWSDEVIGYVTEKASRETGLSANTKVITGTADASAEAFSVGVMKPGEMMIMYGSSIFIIHVVEKFTVDQRLWAGPYLFPGTYAMAAGMSTSGTLTRWYKDQFARDVEQQAKDEGKNVYALLSELAKDIPAGSEGVVVLPYFSGERTPINDVNAKGIIFGLSVRHTREHIYNACLEGVGFGISQHFDVFEEREIQTNKIMAIGGGTKNEKWIQIVSDICGKEQSETKENIGAAYGDALLAALSVGYYKNVAEVNEIIKISKSVKPDIEKMNVYTPIKNKYSDLYKATKELMHRK